MSDKSWDEMTADEKADHTNEALADFIKHQNGANFRIMQRIKALEERLERIEKTRPPN